MIGRGRRLLIVENEALTAGLLAESMSLHGFMAERAGTVRDALYLVEHFDPDAAILDIDLGHGPSGFDLGQMLDRTRPDIALIYLTDYPDLRAAGAFEGEIPERCGFLNKEFVPDSDYLARQIDAVLSEQGRDVRHDRDPARAFNSLDPRQVEVLRYVAMGYTNSHIAAVKGVTVTSVERWTKEIFERLGIDTRGALNPRVEATRIFVAAAGVPVR